MDKKDDFAKTIIPKVEISYDEYVKRQKSEKAKDRILRKCIMLLICALALATVCLAFVLIFI